MIIAISGKKGQGKDTVGSIIQYLTSPEYTDGWRNYDNWLEAIYWPSFKSDWQIKKFADKLKDIVCILIGCTKEQLEDQEFKETPLGPEWEVERISAGFDNNIRFTPRLLLQQIGTELFRNQLHPDVWVNSLLSEYKTECPIENKGSYGHLECGCALDENDIDYGCEKPYPKWIITDLRFKNEKKRIEELGGMTIRVNRITGNVLIDNDTHTITDWQHPSETELDDEEFDYVITNDGTIEDLIEKVREILIKENIIK